MAESTLLAILLTILIQSLGREVLIGIFYPIELPLSIHIQALSIVFFIIGFSMIIWANFTLLYVHKIGLEEREPFHTPSTLVKTGPYTYSRNPIYLGVLLLLVGAFLLLKSITVLGITLWCYLLFRYSFIRWEEEHFEEKFGKEFVEYKKKVRRWI